MAKHRNNGKCEKCEELITEKGVCYTLREWFTDLQEKNPQVHVSCAYRGKEAQEAAVERGASNAHYGESAHNYIPSAALDLFRLTDEGKAEWDVEWYEEEIAPHIGSNLNWGGRWDFKDYPHVELTNWRHMVYTNQLILDDSSSNK